MNDALGRRLVKFLYSDSELLFARLDIAGGDRCAKLANLCSDIRLDCAVSEPVSLVLTETFLGAWSAWHGSIVWPWGSTPIINRTLREPICSWSLLS